MPQIGSLFFDLFNGYKNFPKPTHCKNSIFGNYQLAVIKWFLFLYNCNECLNGNRR